MEILTFPVGQLQANCYLAICSKSRDTVIIDPGSDADFLVEKIQQHQCSPKMIVATHGHFDHVLGITHLKLCLNLPLYLHKNDLFLLKKAPLSAHYWTKLADPVPVPTVDKFIADNEVIKLGEEQLQVIHTPGHTPGSICLYNKKDQVLFAGDTLFKNGIGRTDFSYSNPGQMKQSLQKILTLPDKTVVLPGHGEKTLIGNERVTLT